MKENAYPVDETGKPDLSYYSDPASYYAHMHARAMADGRAREAFALRVHACWGLIANGAESLPYALAMLASGNKDAREDAAAILSEVGKSEAVVRRLVEALNSETEVEARDSLIMALGGLRNRAALPALAKLIEDETTDGDTRWTAVEALGKIVRRRFLTQADPVQSALDWIDKARSRGGL